MSSSTDEAIDKKDRLKHNLADSPKEKSPSTAAEQKEKSDKVKQRADTASSKKSKDKRNPSNVFDVDPGVLNNIQNPLIARSGGGLDTGFDIFSLFRAASEAAFIPDSLKDTGPYKAIVLKAEEANTTKKKPNSFLDYLFGDENQTTVTSIVQIRARIPELQPHLPIPEGPEDHAVIEMYPIFTAQNDTIPSPKPGDVVLVDYVDKTNWTDGIYLTPVAMQQHTPPAPGPAAGYGVKCTPASPMGAGQSLSPNPLPIGPVGEVGSKIRARKAGAKAVIFGDSQSKGSPGGSIADYVESLGWNIIPSNLAEGMSGYTSDNGKFKFAAHKNRVFSRSGARPSHYYKSGGTFSKYSSGLFQFIEPMLKQRPELVVIMAGGNGVNSGDATKLVNKIRQTAGPAQILWFGPPPAVQANGKKPVGSSKWPERWIGFGTSPPPYQPVELFKETRRKSAKIINQELSSIQNTVFVDVLPLMPQYAAAGTPDGIHVNKKGAQELISNLIKRASTPPGGTLMDMATKLRKAGKKTVFGKILSNVAQQISETGAGQSTNEDLYKELKDKELKPFMSQFSTKKKAKSFLKQVSSRTKTTVDILKERDLIRGLLLPPGQDLSKWEPLSFDELSKYHGYTFTPETAPQPDGLDIRVPTTTSIDPGSNPFPNTDEEAHEQIKTLSLKIAAAVEVLGVESTFAGQGAQPKPPIRRATSSGTGAAGCASPSSMGSSGYMPPVNIGSISQDFKMGALSIEEKDGIVAAIAKQLNIEYKLAKIFMEIESGGYTRNGIGGNMKVRFEPHILLKKLAGRKYQDKSKISHISWNGCRGPFCSQFKNSGIPNKHGIEGMEHMISTGIASRTIIYASATYGYAQTFPFKNLSKANLGKYPTDPYEFAMLLKESEDAQIRAFFAYCAAVRPSIIPAIQAKNFPLMAKKYNGASYPYGWFIENKYKGRQKTAGVTSRPRKLTGAVSFTGTA